MPGAPPGEPPKNAMNDSTQTRELPAVVYLGAPLLVVVAPYAAQWVGGRQAWLYGEAGAIEWLTVVFLLAAIVYGVRVLRLATGRGPRWLVVWALLLLLGAVYFAGEELSWGQHVFQWATPETWRQLNPQQETNLHNVHALFDQLPRALLTLAAFVGGVAVPLYRRRTARRPTTQGRLARLLSEDDRDAWPYWLWPTWVCLPVSVAVLITSPFDGLVESFGDAAPDWLYMKGGELKECLLALFISIYVLSLHRRLRAAATTTATATAPQGRC